YPFYTTTATTTANMTETAATPSSSNRQNKSGSRPPSRPHTPLRRSSRGSLAGKTVDDAFPLNALEPAFAELSDAVTTLEVNMADMQIMHDSLSRFSESFASFLYGLNMNAFCVDFTEAPVQESFKRAEEHEVTLGRSAGRGSQHGGWRSDYDAETTFLTNDQSFVHEPAPPRVPTPTKTPARRGPRGGRGGRGSGIARGRGVPRYK
ncbi:DASH complex subunit Dam1-domain-containing protein, partial [Tuber indicum]